MSINVKDFGAVGDGIADDFSAIQAALNKCDSEIIVIPTGDYRVTATLKVGSNTQIQAASDSRIFMCGETMRYRGDFLLSNADTVYGNENITIDGGVWDGNNQGRLITKPDLFDRNGYCGSVLNFVTVKNLNLQNLTVANSITYNVRMSRVENFIIQNIKFFSAEFGFNQDGFHFGGGVKNGIVENIAAISKGQTNDDMLAFNADDSIERVENLDLYREAIENIIVRNVYAEDCHTLVRFLSVNAPIRNIKIENISGGCRCYAVNMDGARYCRTPLFKEENTPKGVGVIENVHIENMTTHKTANHKNPLMAMESNVNNFSITNLKREIEKEPPNKDGVRSLTVQFRNLVDMKVITDSGDSVVLKDKQDCFEIEGDCSGFRLTKA